jgi:hypothetical protein
MTLRLILGKQVLMFGGGWNLAEGFGVSNVEALSTTTSELIIASNNKLYGWQLYWCIEIKQSGMFQ